MGTRMGVAIWKYYCIHIHTYCTCLQMYVCAGHTYAHSNRQTHGQTIESTLTWTHAHPYTNTTLRDTYTYTYVTTATRWQTLPTTYIRTYLHTQKMADTFVNRRPHHTFAGSVLVPQDRYSLNRAKRLKHLVNIILRACLWQHTYKEFTQLFWTREEGEH